MWVTEIPSDRPAKNKQLPLLESTLGYLATACQISFLSPLRNVSALVKLDKEESPCTFSFLVVWTTFSTRTSSDSLLLYVFYYHDIYLTLLVQGPCPQYSCSLLFILKKPSTFPKPFNTFGCPFSGGGECQVGHGFTYQHFPPSLFV